MSGQNGKEEEKTDITQMAGVKAINDGVYLYAVDPELYEGNLEALADAQWKRMLDMVKRVNEQKYGLHFMTGIDPDKPFSALIEHPLSNSAYCQGFAKYIDTQDGKLLILSDEEIRKRANSALAVLFYCIGEDP